MNFDSLSLGVKRYKPVTFPGSQRLVIRVIQNIKKVSGEIKTKCRHNNEIISLSIRLPTSYAKVF